MSRKALTIPVLPCATSNFVSMTCMGWEIMPGRQMPCVQQRSRMMTCRLLRLSRRSLILNQASFHDAVCRICYHVCCLIPCSLLRLSRRLLILKQASFHDAVRRICSCYHICCLIPCSLLRPSQCLLSHLSREILSHNGNGLIPLICLIPGSLLEPSQCLLTVLQADCPEAVASCGEAVVSRSHMLGRVYQQPRLTGLKRPP